MVHLDEASLTVGVATDGSAAQVRALLDEADPGRGLIASFAVRGATLDDVFLTLTATRVRRPPMSDALTMAARSLRLSLRSPDALLTALLLPVMLMVVFVYLFGGAVAHRHQLRRATWSPASCCCARSPAPRPPRSPSART